MKITVEEAYEIAKPLGGGCFKYGDAQGDVTHKFALAVIEWYENRKFEEQEREREREYQERAAEEEYQREMHATHR